MPVQYFKSGRTFQMVGRTYQVKRRQIKRNTKGGEKTMGGKNRKKRKKKKDEKKKGKKKGEVTKTGKKKELGSSI